MISDRLLACGGFADVRTGMYMGHLVAVKTMRVAKRDNYLRLRKVGVEDILSVHFGCDSDYLSPAILQRSCSLEYVVPSERLETRWGSGGHG